ncbi:unnamed protein product [Brachionus calyciflorus]|uniref:Uncharacterized protein n=1 Tax=Brachionus calyciflorus TaxID=104777 RepID=A0A813MW31_9BILA|nr:unnamed protein product [Brachionus calyciflorus]
MFGKVSLIIVLFIGSVYSQENRLLSLLQNPEKILKLTNTDVSQTLNNLGQEISKMAENTMKNQIAKELGISESLFGAINKTQELKNVILENLIDELVKIVLKHDPNATINIEEFSKLSIHEKANLLVDHVISRLHDYLWNLLTNFYNEKPDEILDTNDRGQLEKKFGKLVEKLFGELEELFKNGDKINSENFEEFKKSASHLIHKIKKLVKKYEYYQLAKPSKLKHIKKEFGRTFFKLTKEVEEFLQLNKNNTQLDSFGDSFHKIMKQVDLIVEKINELDKLEGEENESSEEEDKTEEKKQFLSVLKALVGAVDSFFEENDYKQLAEHRTKLEQIKTELISVYTQGEELKNSTDKNNWKKREFLKFMFAKFVREYLATIESFFNVNENNVKLQVQKPEFEKVRESLEKYLENLLNHHKNHNDSSEESEEKSEEKRKFEIPKIIEDKEENSETVQTAIVHIFKQAGRILDQTTDDILTKVEDSIF